MVYIMNGSKMSGPLISNLGQALASATRVTILLRVGRSPATVGRLARELKVTQITVSYHVGILRNVGLVDIEEHGSYHAVRGTCAELRISLRSQAA